MKRTYIKPQIKEVWCTTKHFYAASPSSNAWHAGAEDNNESLSGDVNDGDEPVPGTGSGARSFGGFNWD